MTSKDEAALVAVLKQKGEDLNRLWQEAEERLKNLTLPKVVIVEIGDAECIAWARPGKRWRLCYGYTKFVGSDEPWWFEPLEDCTLDIRLDCISYYNRLLDAMKVAAVESMADLDKSIAAFTELLTKKG